MWMTKTKPEGSKVMWALICLWRLYLSEKAEIAPWDSFPARGAPGLQPLPCHRNSKEEYSYYDLLSSLFSHEEDVKKEHLLTVLPVLSDQSYISVEKRTQWLKSPWRLDYMQGPWDTKIKLKWSLLFRSFQTWNNMGRNPVSRDLSHGKEGSEEVGSQWASPGWRQSFPVEKISALYLCFCYLILLSSMTRAWWLVQRGMVLIWNW